jgi:hypothetical protein
MFQPQVWISLTTIPSRTGGILRGCLDDLMLQTYPVESIIVTIPKQNMRGQAVSTKLPSWFKEEPYSSKLTVLRPDTDSGPILKYIGGLCLIPDGAWVFVCDDDRRYHHDGITRLVAFVNTLPPSVRDASIVNSNLGLEAIRRFSLRLISGFLGVFVSKLFLNTIQEVFDPALPLHCLRIDDDLVSIYARDRGFVVRAGPNVLDLLYNVGRADPDGLSQCYNRFQDRHMTHTRMNKSYVLNLAAAASISCILLAVLVSSLAVTVYVGVSSQA